MAVTYVVGYQTSDGKLFDSSYQAEAYQEKLDLARWFDNHINDEDAIETLVDRFLQDWTVTPK